MAKALIALAPESLNFEIIEIGILPIYDQDLEDNPSIIDQFPAYSRTLSMWVLVHTGKACGMENLVP
jgi:hypothetical protein